MSILSFKTVIFSGKDNSFYLFICNFVNQMLNNLNMYEALLIIATIATILFSLKLYFPFAEKRGMLAGVNHRSSHTKPVITGAGFIFYISYIFYIISFVNSTWEVPWALFLGISILAIVSFIDDLKDLWFFIRLVVQVLAVALMLYQIYIEFSMEPLAMNASILIILAIVGMIFSVGFVNLYNFMDGLNGMMAGITISALSIFWLIDFFVVDFVDDALLIYTAIPTLVFAFFNARRQAICFAGDVGAIVLGYVMVYMLLSLLMQTGNIVYIFIFASVYLEAAMTVLQRLLAGQNIFKPHRIHLFQLLCNEHKHHHVKISGLYALNQLVFGAIIVTMNYYEINDLLQNLTVIGLFSVETVLYFIYKRKLMGGHLIENLKNK
jgi:UDP-N-acetylmuramyl pentapeptide phosphotransferase/UDP-N-acetylglucosamine-1-phosphate transferase